MLSIQINTMAMLLNEFDFLPIYRADLAGSRTLSFDLKSESKQYNISYEKLLTDLQIIHNALSHGTDT